jgi:hypothetical protein
MKYEEFGFHDKDITNIDKVIESVQVIFILFCTSKDLEKSPLVNVIEK